MILETDIEKGKDQFAFDNPCFKDTFSSTPIANGGHQQAKYITKWTQWSPFNLISENDKRKAFDDSFLSENSTKIVSLRSDDFTGLGFNICGNMRDGIFIKDLLQHGPASKSGKLKVGDRIKTVRICFENMVYEDALTILSYASPYAVEIEAQSSCHAYNLDKSRTATRAEEPAHPLFKSASISDLSKIQPSMTPLKIHRKSATLKPSDTVDKAKKSEETLLQKSEQKLRKIGAVLVFPKLKEQFCANSKRGDILAQNENNQNQETEIKTTTVKTKEPIAKTVKKLKNKAPQPPVYDKSNKHCRRTASMSDLAKFEIESSGIEKSKSSSDLKLLKKCREISHSENSPQSTLKKSTIWGNLEDVLNINHEQSFSLCAKFDKNLSKSPILPKHISVLENVSLTNSEGDDNSSITDYKSLGNLENPKSNVLKNVTKIKKLISCSNPLNDNNITISNSITNHSLP